MPSNDPAPNTGDACVARIGENLPDVPNATTTAALKQAYESDNLTEYADLDDLKARFD